MNSSNCKHLLHCVCFYSVIALSLIFLTPRLGDDNFNPFTKYGLPITILVYACRIAILLSLPQVLFNLIGLTLYNAFQDTVELEYTDFSSLPFICIRIVTRGNYPDLVATSVKKNLSICKKLGLINYIIEVVTDNRLNIMSHANVRQVVVPPSYSTSTGALYKARALQYALEDDVNILDDEDWIVHLDEETLLTSNSLKGIINFISRDQHEFGQGVIYYTTEPIVNAMTTIVDSYRVADDLGKIKFQFSIFFRPLLSWKGSFVVARVSAEKDVSFDHGPAGSIAEDAFFAMIAWSKSYTFQFIEGEMYEKSAFTLMDYMRQRKRWLHGIMLVVHSPKIGIIYKLLLASSFYARISILLTSVNIAFTVLYPIPTDAIAYLSTLCTAISYYMMVFGAIRSFKIKKVGIIRFMLYCVGAMVFALPYVLVTEHIVILWSLVSHKLQFYVVKKELNTSRFYREVPTDEKVAADKHSTRKHRRIKSPLRLTSPPSP